MSAVRDILIAMTTQVAARADRARLERERRRNDRIRGDRVRRLGFLSCDVCGGVPLDLEPDVVDPSVADPTLACQCESRRANLQARIARLAYDRRSPIPESGRDRAAR